MATKAISVCTCGHYGDVSLTRPGVVVNNHAGLIGHGACLIQGCTCEKFSWAGYATVPPGVVINKLPRRKRK